VNLTLKNGEKRTGQVLEIHGKQAIVQVSNSHAQALVTEFFVTCRMLFPLLLPPAHLLSCTCARLLSRCFC